MSVREQLRYATNRVEYFPCFRGATILSALEYLIHKGYDEILIVGDNKVNTKEFQDNVNHYIEQIKELASIYQYTNGNFNLPVRSITEFCKGC